MKVFVFAIGAIDPFQDRKAADAAVKFIKTLPGLVAVHPDREYTLLCFDTIGHAIYSWGMWTETGNGAGRYIMNAIADRKKGELLVKSAAWDSQGGPVQ